MAEADAELNNNDDLLQGLEHGDLSSGFYEGGFKTWECAVDLASFACGLDLSHADQGWHVIELGAGTAIPSMTLLKQALTEAKSDGRQPFKFTLCDYNEDVLRLVTAPNAFLASWALSSTDANRLEVNESKDSSDMDLDGVDDSLTQSALEALVERRISINFISGSWGQELIRHVEEMDTEPMNRLILASETVYSPESIRAFTATLVALLRKSKGEAKAYVAAKRIYFGVGGGVDEFRREVAAHGARSKEVSSVQDQGPGRVILEISL